MKRSCLSLEGNQIGEIDLPDEIFSLPVRLDIISLVVRYQMEARHKRTASNKGRSEVRRSGAKIYAQKGTGRARHGARSPSLFRGGGVAFSKSFVPATANMSLNKKVKNLALKMALSLKAADGGLIICDSFDIALPKTSAFVSAIKNYIFSPALFVYTDSATNENFLRASKNVRDIDVLDVCGINVYDIMRRDVLVLSSSSILKIKERLL